MGSTPIWGTLMGIWYSWLTHLPCTQESPVRIRISPQCNDSETNGGTDAKNEMETFEARIKEWIRYKPHSHYIIGPVAQLVRAAHS